MISNIIQEADWKLEKHVPVIECQDTVQADKLFQVQVGIGKEGAHPNTAAHHISWISLYFHPQGEKFPYHIGHYEFLSHGASVQGADSSSIYTHHQVTTSLTTSKPGTLLALSLCNIHGLWQSAREIKVA